jgi:hypothetical protein
MGDIESCPQRSQCVECILKGTELVLYRNYFHRIIERAYGVDLDDKPTVQRKSDIVVC